MTRKKVATIALVTVAMVGTTFFCLRKRPLSPDAAPPPGIDHAPSCMGDRACAVAKANALAVLARPIDPPLYSASTALSAALFRGDCEAATELARGVEGAEVDRGKNAALAQAADAALLGRDGFCSGSKRRALEAPPPQATVTLERRACFGSCPVYEVTVRADGEVTFVGRSYVAFVGTKSTRISPARARELFAAFDRLSFWKMNASYNDDVSDAARATLTVTLGGRTKTVSDGAACSGAGSLTAGLCYLERRTDEIAQTERNVETPKR